MTIFLQKVSDFSTFQYSFLSRHNLNRLKAKMIAHYKAMIEALEQDDRDFRRYLKYETKLRRAILSGRYSNERLEYLRGKVREMRWYIEEEFGKSPNQCICVLPSPQGYAEEAWKNARDSALARRSREKYEARRSEMHATINRGEACYEDFCRGCCHRWTEKDVDEWEDDYHHVIHRTWVCPECGGKMWEDEEVW